MALPIVNVSKSHVFSRGPRKMYVVNLATQDFLVPQFNPRDLEEAISVVYDAKAPVGMSHTVLQYSHTENHVLRTRLSFRADSPDDARRLRDARRFLMALCYARGAEEPGMLAAPPRAMFVWPEIVAMNVRVREVLFRHTRFNTAGAPVATDVDVDLVEARDVRLLSEDVAAHGTVREGVLGRVLE